ncbi:MAG: hypothetical protein IJE58_03800 [Oscillospiraceae bacterium]|nr:hypothetical protein [Oscillospiraceae bacterium]
MIDRCITILRAKLDELRRLLAVSDLPGTAAEVIRAQLDRMEQIITETIKGQD